MTKKKVDPVTETETEAKVPEADAVTYNIKAVGLTVELELFQEDGKVLDRQPSKTIMIYEANPFFPTMLEFLKSGGLKPQNG